MADLKHILAAMRVNLRDMLHYYPAYAEVPRQPRVDDLYLVEFPKSGITWLSFLIANTNLLLSGQPYRRATFFNINDFVTDISIDRHVGPPILPVPGHRVIKSHSAFNLAHKKVFYLVRDPRKVMLSYYKFLTGLGSDTCSLATMIEHPKHGIGAWRDHVSGWIERIPPYHFFSMVRYEDLIADTAGQLRNLYALQGIALDDAIVGRAIERSSIDEMRQDEKRFNRTHPNLQGFNFVRKLPALNAASDMTDTVRQRIEDVAGPLMNRLGYK